MNEAEMIGIIVLASVTILGFLTAIIKPIIDLNKSITQLIASVDRLVEEQIIGLRLMGKKLME